MKIGPVVQKLQDVEVKEIFEIRTKLIYELREIAVSKSECTFARIAGKVRNFFGPE